VVAPEGVAVAAPGGGVEEEAVGEVMPESVVAGAVVVLVTVTSDGVWPAVVPEPPEVQAVIPEAAVRPRASVARRASRASRGRPVNG